MSQIFCKQKNADYGKFEILPTEPSNGKCVEKLKLFKTQYSIMEPIFTGFMVGLYIIPENHNCQGNNSLK